MLEVKNASGSREQTKGESPCCGDGTGHSESHVNLLGQAEG